MRRPLSGSVPKDSDMQKAAARGGCLFVGYGTALRRSQDGEAAPDGADAVTVKIFS